MLKVINNVQLMQLPLLPIRLRHTTEVKTTFCAPNAWIDVSTCTCWAVRKKRKKKKLRNEEEGGPQRNERGTLYKCLSSCLSDVCAARLKVRFPR